MIIGISFAVVSGLGKYLQLGISARRLTWFKASRGYGGGRSSDIRDLADFELTPQHLDPQSFLFPPSLSRHGLQ